MTPAPKDGESGSSVTSPSTGNHSDESGAPSETPTGDSTATQPSDSTSSPVTPSEEAPVTSGDTNSTTQPAGESGSSEQRQNLPILHLRKLQMIQGMQQHQLRLQQHQLQSQNQKKNLRRKKP